MSKGLRRASNGPCDEELLACVAAGDLGALGALYDRYERDVRRLVGRLGVSNGDADDLIQLTFLDLARAAGRYDGHTSARSWLFGIATMMVRRHRRSIARTLSSVAARMFESRRAQPVTPSQAHESEENQMRFERALARLSAKKREVFVLVTMEGASGEQVARMLRVPVGTVWTRLHYARRELQAELLGSEP